MSDLISRQAAIDTAMNDSLIINAMDSVKDGDIHRTKRAIVRLLASLPSIDAVPVIRCKDCKWWEKKPESCYGYCFAARHVHFSNHWDVSIYRTYKEDFFCADGERKEE